MKKTVKTIMYLTMTFILMFCLAGCGDSKKKSEAKDVFNKTSGAFNEVAALINDNPDAIDDDIIAVFQEMSATLTDCKERLEKSDAADEDYDKVIAALGDVDNWLKDAKVEIEAEIEAAN